MIEKYLVASNTPDGFLSKFDLVTNEQYFDKVYYLKGGAGTGKSTFMKKIAETAKSKGYHVNALPCSADLSSIDVITIKELKVSIVDATYPHIIDPKNPGLTGEIVNLGNFLNTEKLKPFKKEIEQFQKEKKVAYELLYKYLGSSKSLASGIEYITKPAMNIKHIELISTEIFTDFLCKQQPIEARIGFLDALTPNGYVNLFDQMDTEKCVGINCKYDIGITEFYRQLFKKLDLSCHKYYSVKNPENIAHISVGNITVVSNPKRICDYSFDLEGAFDKKQLKQFESELMYLEKKL